MNKKILRTSFLTVGVSAFVLILSGCMGDTETLDDKAVKEDALMVEQVIEEADEVVEPQQVDDIVDVVLGSQDHTTLATAVAAANLVETLQGEGPFTVFAPTDAAFNGLPAGTVDTLLMPENNQKLIDILTYHVVPAKAMAVDVVQAIADNGGTYEVTTVSGGMLILASDNGAVTVTDENGNSANVVIADLEASNGVIHVVDAVLLPQNM